MLMFRNVAALAAVAFLLWACASKPAYQEAPLSRDEVRVPISSLKEASPVFYSFFHSRDGDGAGQGKGRVDFFVFKKEGRVESYLDACARCWAKKKGFRVNRSSIACNACGVSYPLDNIKAVGSCYPLPLKGEVRGDLYVIEKEELLKALKYF